MLSPTQRLPSLERLIEQRSYFVIHAPPQTGKTTAMMALAKQLTESSRFVALIVSVEVGAAFPHDPGKAELAILGTWRESAQFYLPTDLQPPPWVESAAGQQIQASLRVWAEASPRPLVIVNGGGTLEREYAVSWVVISLKMEKY
jgi:hypothetical protein